MTTAAETRIGGLLVERILGEGGMGRVLLCRDDALDRQVAVKTLLPSLLNDEGMRARFLREAKALAKVRSPNVVTVHSVGEDGAAGPYVVMELLDGEDVLQILRQREKLDVALSLKIAEAACTGLSAAHEAGLLHRDVKPANLFVKKDGSVVLTDFGLAKEIAPPGSVDSSIPPAQLTQLGVVVGTPAYLAPELAKGTPASVASDLYALGATLFHLLAGRPPFEGDAPLDVISKAVMEAPPRLSSVRPDVPIVVDEAVAACLHKDPRDRPKDAATLKALLSAPAASSSSTTTPASQTTMALGSFNEATAAPAPQVSSPAVPVAAAPTASPAAFSSGLNEISSPGRMSVKTATLTVMMTDIAGYTERTSRQSREEAARWLSLHDALLQPVFRAFSGKVVKTIGDAFLVTFASPTDAVHCGMAVQDRLFQHNLTAAVADRIEVRVALSAGEVRLHKGDIFGEPVNLAARLEGLAQKGEVLLTDAVYATMNAAEVKTESRGSHAFKGISREVSVYAAVPEPAGSLPFGGRALAKVKTTGLAVAAAAAAPLAQEVAQGVLSKVARVPPKVLAAAAGVVVVFVLFAVLSGDGRKARIEKGDAAAVREEVEKIPEKDRSESDVVVLALAHHKLESRAKAWKMLRKPAEQGLDDDDVLDLAIADLALKDDAGAVEVVAAWHDDQSSDMRDLLDQGWDLRHHALDVLEAKKTVTDDDRLQVAWQDIEEDDCGRRRLGMFLLKKSGKGPKALSAVKALGANMPANLCMALDVGGAEAAIKGRSDK